MRCGFCGREFDPAQNVACDGCPMHRSCHLVKCPHCGYEMPPEPRLVKLIRSWRKKDK